MRAATTASSVVVSTSPAVAQKMSNTSAGAFAFMPPSIAVRSSGFMAGSVHRMNIAVIAMNWTRAEPYYPSWMEVLVSVTIVTIGVLTFRWIVNRMPVLRAHPEYPDAH